MTQTLRALLVDSDQENLELMIAVLTRDGFVVQATPDGGDGMARFFDTEPHLVISGLDNAVFTGPYLSQQIKAARPSTRVILLVEPDMSASACRALCVTAACDATLARPFRFAALRRLLQNFGLHPSEKQTVSSRAFGVPQPEAIDIRAQASAFSSPVPAALSTVPIPIALGAIPKDLAAAVAAPTPAALPLEPESDDVDDDVDLDLLPDGVPSTGTLEEFPLPRLVFELYLATFSGELQLQRHGLRRSVYFFGGFPVRVDSQQMAFDLGHMLLSQGHISKDQYDASQTLMQQSHCAQGEALRRIGALTEAQLLAALHEQTASKLTNAFAWRDGHFELRASTDFVESTVLSKVHPVAAIWQGIAAHYDDVSLEAFFAPHASMYLVATPLFSVHVSAIAQLFDASLWVPWLDGRQTLGSLLSKAHRGMGVCQVVYALLVTDMAVMQQHPGDRAKVPASMAASPTKQSPTSAVSGLLASLYLRVKEKNYFEMLGLSHDADAMAVAAAYETLAAHVAPSALPGELSEADKNAVREIRLGLKLALETLSDETTRLVYVRELQAHGGDAAAHQRQRRLEANEAYERGLAALQAFDPGTAKHHFEAAIAALDGEPLFYVGLGDCLRLLETTSGAAPWRVALEHYQKALRLDPANQAANLAVARLLFDTEHRQSIQPYLVRVLRQDPTNAEAKQMQAALDAAL